ncbi:flagellar hook-basal body complex protein [Bradyrhizobium sp. Tv2a-2]|uniref:flagellar hook-basal body complex protein n=1 Tax=Bradyrhizobium sp. Tv2a-2 TaxID=113395 RepID=UPI0004225195|nr:flagellar hook-basal body complex protein [Bradyrhizobium sp. Tv2a-2]
MGIFDALNTAVGGLQAQSFALQNISGNIANASTVGYKGIGTSFEDLVPDSTTPNKQVAGGVTAFAQQTITTQGTVSSSTVATNMAINGDGFFSVQKPTSITDNQPVFSGTTDYTRRGDFQVNSNGNLVNGAGYYLMGVTVDPTTGNPTGNVPQVLQFQNNFIPAQATTAVQYAANLPTQPKTAASTSAATGTITAAGGLNPADFSSNPLAIGTTSYLDNTTTGTPVNNKLGAAITSATLLSGAAGTDSIGTDFAAGDTITVDGQTITFMASGASGNNQINVTDSVGTLLGKIGAITGVTPTISSTGAITLHTGTSQSLSASSSNTTAFSALGLTSGLSQTRTPSSGNGAVVANDMTAFTNESISGGAVTAYNAAGTPINLQLRWVKTDSASLGGAHQDTWNLFYQTSTTASGGQTAWVNAGTNFTFASDGSLSSPTGSALTIPNVSVDNLSLGNLTINISSGALTQFASTSGAATINQIQQNGFAAGQLQSVAINNSGIVVGTFSNGQNIDLAQVTLSHFNGTNYLKALDGGAYQATTESGAAIIGASGTISGSSLEGSNTDIADEFTKLIVTQQAYSANTKVITTANSMVQDLLNVLR